MEPKIKTNQDQEIKIKINFKTAPLYLKLLAHKVYLMILI